MKGFLSTILVAALCCSGCGSSQKPEPQADFRTLVASGEFTKATEAIQKTLSSDATLSEEARREMRFEIERMDRIRKDFKKTRPEVVEFIKQYMPAVTDQDLDRWEKERSLEMMTIDGEKRYFNNAARGLFRIDKDCLRVWDEKHTEEMAKPRPEGALDLDAHVKTIRDQALLKKQPFVEPIRLRIRYTISVNPDVVPAGEVIRCWIPYPREIPERQIDIRLVATDPADHRLAPNEDLQRMIYFEKSSVQGEPTKFGIEYEYTSSGVYVDIDPEQVKPVDPQGSLKPYLEQEAPHIVFTDALRELSKQVVGTETNPYRVAQKLYAWVEDHTPWSLSREYSTIPNLSMYAYENHHGDCGIQALLMITLCRMNNIPARWQSGWEFKPPTDSMHDWGMVYFEPYGWVPMDVTYGRRNTDDEKLKWFYLNGMDSYRLIFNDALTQPFTPVKEHFRSETVDSQRGEVEWKGGNLFFDQWDWDMKWEVLTK
ncbi:MAG: transglutaminase domain-containing protein [Deltaproteobacteria bacterium]|nr:transglutaminase domain-containing protein [Deltaproteobacteria bacterium]